VITLGALLCPAGNMEALIAAVSNGCDEIYLGMSKFGARAYANNFDNEGIIEAVKYCHLRGVKVFVTMNTIVFDRELDEAYQQIDYLYKVGVDGIIIQDLAIFNYVVRNYPLMEAHTSTQMGLDDKEGALLLKELGANRIVLARELPIDSILSIKKATKLPLEIFCHGALCVSYSGGCLMSGLIGFRSGNRGRCVGSCRKKYKLVNEDTGELLGDSYLFSMKDLNTIDFIDKIKVIDSLKIEGRMKEPEYVANVCRTYRQALDGKLTNELKLNLNKTFNRTYTKGYIFGEDKKNIVNISRPNNFGYPIGKVKRITKLGYELELQDELNQNDIVRIARGEEDIVFSVRKLYDKNDNYINSSNSSCFIKIKEQLKVGDIIYKTKDVHFYDELLKTYPKEYRKFDCDVVVYANALEPMYITTTCGDTTISITSDFICDKAIQNPLTEEKFRQSFAKMNDSVYQLNELSFYAPDIFLPVSKINELRRKVIEALNEERYKMREEVALNQPTYLPLTFDRTRNLSVSCINEEQVAICKELGVDIIYYGQNIIRRNKNHYQEVDGEVLVGGYGGISYYRNKNEFSTDYLLNCVNSETVYTLHKLGAKRVCLSYEINLEDINNLVNEYKYKTGGMPNLEMIVYGRAPLMFTNYCPLKVYNQCGKCKKNQYYIEEEYGKFPLISHEDCTTTILNGKILNLIDDLDKLDSINTFRLAFTKESKEKVREIVTAFQKKLNGETTSFKFNNETDTRGHFNKEIL